MTATKRRPRVKAAEIAAQAPVADQFFLVSDTIDGSLRCQDYDTLDELRTAVKELLSSGEDVWLFAFRGQRLQFTTGPYRYIIPPTGEPVPLFDIPDVDEMQIAEDGLISVGAVPADDDEDLKDEELANDDAGENEDDEIENDLDAEIFGDDDTPMFETDPE